MKLRLYLYLSGVLMEHKRVSKLGNRETEAERGCRRGGGQRKRQRLRWPGTEVADVAEVTGNCNMRYNYVSIIYT